MGLLDLFRQEHDDRLLYDRFLDSLGPQFMRPLNHFSSHASQPALDALGKMGEQQQEATLLSMQPFLLTKDEITYQERQELHFLFDHLLRAKVPATVAAFDMMLKILLEPANGYDRYYSLLYFERYLDFASTCDYLFTPDQKQGLGEMARRLEKSQDNVSTKDEQKKLLKLVRRLDGLAETPPDDRNKKKEKIAELLAVEPSPNRFRPLPENIEFWCEFLDLVSDKAELLKKEIVSKKATWLNEERSFCERFRSVAGIPIEFGFWNADNLADGRNFSVLRKPEKRDRKDPVLVRMPLETLKRLREDLKPLADHLWCRPWMPEADLLLGGQSDAEIDFVLMLTEARAGPKPSAKWVKNAGKLIEKIGPEEIESRIHNWLSVFSRPGYNDTTLELLADCHARARHAQAFERLFPEWKKLTVDDREALADWVAVTSIGFARSSPLGLECFLHHYGKSLSDKERLSKIRAPFQYEDGERKDYGAPYGRPYAFPTLLNENALRAVTWLLGERASAENVALLEDTAMAATGVKDSDRYRSRSVANAAIESLGRIGTPEALYALGRLRRSIKDKAIGNTVQKAMDKLAEKHSVHPDDVAEQSLPDYGFE